MLLSSEEEEMAGMQSRERRRSNWKKAVWVLILACWSSRFVLTYHLFWVNSADRTVFVRRQGANYSGKSVFLKMIAMLTFMAQIGESLTFWKLITFSWHNSLLRIVCSCWGCFDWVDGPDPHPNFYEGINHQGMIFLFTVNLRCISEVFLLEQGIICIHDWLAANFVRSLRGFRQLRDRLTSSPPL